nr:helitron helicase-like domain-containing protein [Tanacetum cinerariifolium]
DIVEGLIDLLDNHNALLKLFRTSREKFADAHIPDFKIRLYNIVGAQEYELPTGDTLGAIVYEAGPKTEMDCDIVIEQRSGYPQRVNKLHPSYMLLQFLLLFIYGEDIYSKELKLVGSFGFSSATDKRLSMKACYAYYLHNRINCYNLLSRMGRLFPQYVVTALCAIEQNSIDYIRDHRSAIRNEQARVHKDEDIDSYISDELPSKDIDPECHRIVSELMMHGPCRLACPTASCTDHVVVHISRSTANSSASADRSQIIVDEIKNFLDASDQANSLTRDCNEVSAEIVDTGSTSKRPDFILETVFKTLTLSLPAPLPTQPPFSKSATTSQGVLPTSPVSPAAASIEPETIEASIKEPPKEQSTPPSEQQTTSMQKEDAESKLPNTSKRKALFESKF